MAFVCLKCGNVARVLPRDGRCSKCGAQIAEPAVDPPPRMPARERARSASAGTPEPRRRAADADFSPETGNLCIGLFVAAVATYVLGIFLPLATIRKHMGALDAVSAAEKTGTGGALTTFASTVLDFFGENPTIVDEANTFSLVSGLGELLAHGQFFLFLIILAFSILFPITKMVLLGFIAFYDVDATARERQLKWLTTFGKWSMLDVFVIALLVVSLKLGDLVNVQIHAGLYFFAASVLLTMVLTHILKKAKS